jgi:hypothetical protein
VDEIIQESSSGSSMQCTGEEVRKERGEGKSEGLKSILERM